MNTTSRKPTYGDYITHKFRKGVCLGRLVDIGFSGSSVGIVRNYKYNFLLSFELNNLSVSTDEEIQKYRQGEIDKYKQGWDGQS